MRAPEKKSSKTRKANRYLRQILCEIAIAASRTNCQFSSFHKVLKIRRGYQKSTVAVAHKMMRVIYQMLKENKPYKDPEIDYEELLAKRNAPRWIASLIKYDLVSAVVSKTTA